MPFNLYRPIESTAVIKRPTPFLFWPGTIAFVTVILFFGLAGCGRPGSSDSASAPSGKSVSAQSAAAPEAGAVPANAKAVPTPRRIIYTADVALTTDSLASAARDIESKVKQCDGYVADSALGVGESKRRTGTWKVRVPVVQFDTFVKSLQGIGDVVSTNISSSDVSEEFYDVEARLRNKQAEETRLLLHLKSSTARLSDILAVERELSRVREEIERIQGRLRFLTNQTDLTTVNITVDERGNDAKSSPVFATEIGRAFAGSVKAMGDFARGLTLVTIALLPWLLLAGAIGLPFYLRRRNRLNGTKR